MLLAWRDVEDDEEEEILATKLDRTEVQTQKFGKVNPHDKNLNLALCTQPQNIIKCYNIQEDQSVSIYEGAQLKGSGSRTLLEKIGDTGLFISSNSFTSSSFEVIDIRKSKKVFRFEETKGKILEIAHNERFGIAALLSVRDKISYCVFDCVEFGIKKRAKWQQLQKGYAESLDFHPEGELLSTMDAEGTCVVSDVNSGKYLFHSNAVDRSTSSWFNRCRWNPIPERGLLAMKTSWNKLNLTDLTKQQNYWKKPLILDIDHTICIQWSSDGNLLACAGTDRNIKIFDVRQSKIVKNIKTFHTREILMLKWSEGGDVIATGSDDGFLRVQDIANERDLFVDSTVDGSNFVLFV